MVRLISRYWCDIEGWLNDCSCAFATLPSLHADVKSDRDAEGPSTHRPELLTTAKIKFFARVKAFLLLMDPLRELDSSLFFLTPTFDHLFLTVWKANVFTDKDEYCPGIGEDDIHLSNLLFKLVDAPFSQMKTSFTQLMEDESPDGVKVVTNGLKRIFLFSSENGNISCNAAVASNLILYSSDALLVSCLHEGLLPLFTRICYRYLFGIASFNEIERDQLWSFVLAQFTQLHKLFGFDAPTFIPQAGCGKVIIKLIWRALSLDMLYGLPRDVKQIVTDVIQAVTGYAMYYSVQRDIESIVLRYSNRSTEGLAESLKNDWRFLCWSVVAVGIPLRRCFLAEEHHLCSNDRVSFDSGPIAALTGLVHASVPSR
jgi:hypothetical protein